MSAVDSSRDAATLSAALRLLGRRPLTTTEMRARLELKGHSREAIDRTCRRLQEDGYLDDDQLALDFIVTRAERLAHGPGRLIADLCARGIARAEAEEALRLAVERGDLVPEDVLRRRLQRHLRGTTLPLSRRDATRVYNALFRAGFDEDAIRRELDRYRDPATHSSPIPDEMNDDFA